MDECGVISPSATWSYVRDYVSSATDDDSLQSIVDKCIAQARLESDKDMDNQTYTCSSVGYNFFSCLYHAFY